MGVWEREREREYEWMNESSQHSKGYFSWQPHPFKW